MPDPMQNPMRYPNPQTPEPDSLRKESGGRIGRTNVYKYLLRKAWLMELILLAIPPPACMLLASASSNALCVTDASALTIVSGPFLPWRRRERRKMRGREEKEELGIAIGHSPSKSLKLLPMLGVPSLPSRPFNSAVRFGDNGPCTPPLPLLPMSCLLVPAAAAELVDESDVWLCCVPTADFLCAWVCTCGRLAMCRGSPRNVALGSWCVVSVGGAKGMKAGSSSSSSASASSDWTSLLEKRGGRRRSRL